MILSQKDINRFWNKVAVGGENDCWPWLAGKSKFGHGVFSVKHKWVAAHRVSFFIAKGYLPNIKNKKLVMHACENPACQNPKHLIEGTVKENGNYPGHIAKQKNKIGCWRGVYGEENKARWGKRHSVESKKLMSQSAHSRKLTEQEVVAILKSAQSSKMLAQKHNVSRRLIRLIRERKRWKHVQI